MNSIVCERRVYSNKNKVHIHPYGHITPKEFRLYSK